MVGRVSILYIKAMSNCKIICLLQDLETSCIKRNHLEQFTRPRPTVLKQLIFKDCISLMSLVQYKTG